MSGGDTGEPTGSGSTGHGSTADDSTARESTGRNSTGDESLGHMGPPVQVEQEAATTRKVRRRYSARWAAGGALVVAAAVVVVLATSGPASLNEVNTPLLGVAAPAVSGHTVEGAQFDLSSYRGRWVVLNFFASWCPPCQQEMPDLVTFAYQHRHAHDAALVGVVFDDSASRARGFFSQSGARWPAVKDPSGQIALDYGVRGPPEIFLVSPQGIVMAHLDGPATNSGLDSELARVQRGKA